MPVLEGYPLPNQPGGAFGDRTFATSSKVYTHTDQFSVRVDHQISTKTSLLVRFSLNQVKGPLTNPDQTAINPNFGVHFFDHQRNHMRRNRARIFHPRVARGSGFGIISKTAGTSRQIQFSLKLIY